MRFLILALLIGSGALAAPSARPSTKSCDYYKTLEESLQCGPESYLMKDGYPLCEHYRKISPRMTKEIQRWFPKIRYCLQLELDVLKEGLTCENLDQAAIETHVNCYVQTGYCDLSLASRTQLTLVTLPRMLDPMWRKTAELILKACNSKPGH